MHAAVQVTDLEELPNQTMREVSGWSCPVVRRTMYIRTSYVVHTNKNKSYL